MSGSNDFFFLMRKVCKNPKYWQAAWVKRGPVQQEDNTINCRGLGVRALALLCIIFRNLHNFKKSFISLPMFKTWITHRTAPQFVRCFFNQKMGHLLSQCGFLEIPWVWNVFPPKLTLSSRIIPKLLPSLSPARGSLVLMILETKFLK